MYRPRSVLLAVLLTVSLLLSAVDAAKKKPAAQSDEEEEDDMKYAGIARCAACERAVSRIVEKARVTPLGQAAKSMHRKKDAATELKRTKLARATELVEQACEGEDKGQAVVRACEEIVGQLDDQFTDWVVEYLDPEKVNNAVNTKKAEDYGKDKICLDFCDYKSDLKKSVEASQSKMREEALRKYYNEYGLLGVWKVISETIADQWPYFVVLMMGTFVVSLWYQLRNAGRGKGRRLKEE